MIFLVSPSDGENIQIVELMFVVQLLLKGTQYLYFGEEVDQPHVSLRKKRYR